VCWARQVIQRLPWWISFADPNKVLRCWFRFRAAQPGKKLSARPTQRRSAGQCIAVDYFILQPQPHGSFLSIVTLFRRARGGHTYPVEKLLYPSVT
jgi:hypothetical protein